MTCEADLHNWHNRKCLDCGEEMDSNEDDKCMECGTPTGGRYLFCSEECEKKHELKEG